MKHQFFKMIFASWYKRWWQKNRHRWYKKQSRCALYRKRQKPLGRKLSILLMIWVKSRSYISYIFFCNFNILGLILRVFWFSVIESSSSQAMLKTSSDIWLATSFLNLLNNNLFQSFTYSMMNSPSTVILGPDNAPFNDPQVHSLDWKTISSKPEHRTKQPKIWKYRPKIKSIQAATLPL